MKQQEFRDRIQGFKRIDPSKIDPDARNARRHPERQKSALRALLTKIGIVDAVVVRAVAGGRYKLVDGHLRRDTIGQKIPALIVDLNDAEAAEMLATMDAVGDLAEVDEAALRALVTDFEPGPEVRAMLSALVDDAAPLDFGAGLEAPDARGDGIRVDEEDAFGALPSGDKEPFQQANFTLHVSQLEAIKEALAKARAFVVPGPNTNSNGNALHLICEAYLGRR